MYRQTNPLQLQASCMVFPDKRPEEPRLGSRFFWASITAVNGKQVEVTVTKSSWSMWPLGSVHKFDRFNIWPYYVPPKQLDLFRQLEIPNL